MSLKKIVGGILFVAGVLLAIPTLGASLGLSAVAAGILSAGLLIASSVLLGPSLPKMPGSLANGGRERLNATLDVRAFRKILFGITAGATDVRYQTWTGAEQEYLEMIVCVASHKVNSIYELWLDNEMAWSSAGGVVSKFSGYLTVTTRTEGTSANGIAIDSVWTATATLTGCAYLHLKFKVTGPDDQTPGPFSSGVTQRMTIRCQGAFVYDPRLDSTVTGGSGAHRADNQSTWTFSTNGSRNPALQLLFYLLGWKINSKLALGMGLPKARIDLPSFITAANICDESVTKSAANGGGTEPRYRCDGVLSEGDDRNAVVEALCASMNAILRDAGGKLSLTVLKNDLASPVASFTEDDILGTCEWSQTPDLSASFNITRGQRIDPSDNALYQPTDYAEVKLTSNDGIDRIDTFDLPLVESNGQAQRLAKQRLQRGQYQGRLSLSGKPKWWQTSVGDVIQLSHQSFGWSNKLFRVAGQTISRTGETQMLLLEENAALYQWDNNESAAVTPGSPTIYDPTFSPTLMGVVAASAPIYGNLLTDVLFGGKWTKSAGAVRKQAIASSGYAKGNTAWFLELSPSTSQARTADSEYVPVTAGQRYYFAISAQRGTTLGSGSRLRMTAFFYDSAKAFLSGTGDLVEWTPSTLTAGAVPVQGVGSGTAPAGAAFVVLRVYTPALASSSGTFRVEAPVVSVTDLAGTPEIGYGPASHTVKYSAAGVPESGELPKDLAYILYLGGVAQTDGVTWTYKVTSGTVNGFTAASGAQSMTGAGTGTFTLTTLDADSATVEISAAKSGSTAKTTLSLKKQSAVATGTTGGGAGDSPSQTSGFTDFSGSTFVVISNVLTYTVPTGQSSITATVNLEASPTQVGGTGSWTVEMKVQRDIGGTWTDQGAVFSDISDVALNPDTGFNASYPATLSGTRQSTGLTAGTQYSFRIVARAPPIAGGTRSHYVSGSVSLAAP